jgi:hypothetical protein
MFLTGTENIWWCAACTFSYHFSSSNSRLQLAINPVTAALHHHLPGDTDENHKTLRRFGIAIYFRTENLSDTTQRIYKSIKVPCIKNL